MPCQSEFLPNFRKFYSWQPARPPWKHYRCQGEQSQNWNQAAMPRSSERPASGCCRRCAARPRWHYNCKSPTDPHSYAKRAEKSLRSHRIGKFFKFVRYSFSWRSRQFERRVHSGLWFQGEWPAKNANLHNKRAQGIVPLRKRHLHGRDIQDRSQSLLPALYHTFLPQRLAGSRILHSAHRKNARAVRESFWSHPGANWNTSVWDHFYDRPWACSIQCAPRQISGKSHICMLVSLSSSNLTKRNSTWLIYYV